MSSLQGWAYVHVLQNLQVNFARPKNNISRNYVACVPYRKADACGYSSGKSMI